MKIIKLIGVLLLVLLVTGPATAATTDEAVVRQRFVAMGMQPTSNGTTTLRATLGEPIVAEISNSGSELCVGFWCGWPFLYQLQLPMVIRVN
ncbi:MAG: hypothetical protein P1S60_12585 [Anaerolineae bacterium]|nr:hypothetical protein [Anaerolineae bacterium]